MNSTLNNETLVHGSMTPLLMDFTSKLVDEDSDPISMTASYKLNGVGPVIALPDSKLTMPTTF